MENFLWFSAIHEIFLTLNYGCYMHGYRHILRSTRITWITVVIRCQKSHIFFDMSINVITLCFDTKNIIISIQLYSKIPNCFLINISQGQGSMKYYISYTTMLILA